MPFNPKPRLRQFYDQALLSPELLCLHCTHTAWNQAACRCSPQRQEDCALFVNDMVNWLSVMEPQPAAKPSPPDGLRP